MEKRYQVFISSTYRDLHLERQEIIRALLELDCIPAGMELFPASDDDAWTLIKRVIDESDYYLVVSAGRYGSVHPETGIGYTEMEYDYAVSRGKPAIAFLHNDLASISVERSDTEKELKEKLARFREKMQKKVTKYWSTPDTLAGVASRSIIQLIKQKPAVGWVRSDQAPDPRTQNELSQLKLLVAERERELAELKDRLSSAPMTEAAFSGIFGIGKATQYIKSRLGSDKVVPVLFGIYSILMDSQRERGWIKQGSLLAAISNQFSVDEETAADILYSLISDQALDLDGDGDIIINYSVESAFREMRLQLNSRQPIAVDAKRHT